MSAAELRALRYVAEGMPEAVAEAHKALLLRMGLAKLGEGGVLEATPDGVRRLCQA
jgi:hypothetical protein